MRTIQCQLCGEKIEVNSVNKYCFECKKKRKQELKNQSARRSYPRRKQLVKERNRERYLKNKEENELFEDKYYSK